MVNRDTTTKPKSTEQETFGLLLLSVRLNLIRRGERLLVAKGFDINFTQFRVLYALSQCQSLSATELARGVEHDGGALTRLLDCLQGKGYVARRPNAKDRRAIEVSMTEKGRAVWDSMRDCVTQANTEVLEALSDAEQTQLFGFLHRIRDYIDA
ncbi:MAG: MarR family transcriptional regulator [Sterolibacterium sp.]|nr:MarR family transcriptional regulator [Sterolibacterium sp.]